MSVSRGPTPLVGSCVCVCVLFILVFFWCSLGVGQFFPQTPFSHPVDSFSICVATLVWFASERGNRTIHICSSSRAETSDL